MAEKPDYRSFLCDGQFTLLEDYLEIRPETKHIIKKYVSDGHLEIGPWFSLPDCAPIQGEWVVRNLQYGIKKSREFGELLKCGYNVFLFGQIMAFTVKKIPDNLMICKSKVIRDFSLCKSFIC